MKTVYSINLTLLVHSSQHFNRQWEYDSRVLFSGYRLQGLQVPELESRWTLRNDLRGFFQALGGIHFSFSCDDLWEMVRDSEMNAFHDFIQELSIPNVNFIDSR